MPSIFFQFFPCKCRPVSEHTYPVGRASARLKSIDRCSCGWCSIPLISLYNYNQLPSKSNRLSLCLVQYDKSILPSHTLIQVPQPLPLVIRTFIIIYIPFDQVESVTPYIRQCYASQSRPVSITTNQLIKLYLCWGKDSSWRCKCAAIVEFILRDITCGHMCSNMQHLKQEWR